MELMQLPVKRIVADCPNPRTVNEKEADFADLVASIGARGVIIPIHVRVHPKRKDKYQLLAGERRWRAAQKAKVATIGAVDHGELSDAEAFEITFTENFCRKDLTVLEEGKAVSLLLEKYAGDAKAVASKLGKSSRWVHLRSAIHTSLTESWSTLIARDERFKKWTAGHLARIARFPASVQEDLCKRANKSWPWNNCQDWAIADLEKYCSAELMLLAQAPFDTSPTSKCAQCPKRSSAQPTLWAEQTDDVVADNDRCLDRACWLKREASACQRLLRAKKAKYDDLVCISNAATFNEDAARLKQCYGGYLSAGQFEICKKKDKGAKPALVIAGKDKGKVRYVKVKQAASSTTPKSRKPSATERTEQLETQRWGEVADRLAERLGQVSYAEIPGAKVAAVCLVATVVGAEPIRYGFDTAAFCETVEKARAGGPADVLETLLVRLWSGVQNMLDYEGFASSEGDRQAMRLIAETFGIDWQVLCDDVNDEHKGKDADNREAA